MKKILLKATLALFIMPIIIVGCKLDPIPPQPDENLTSVHSAKVATDWFTLEADLIKSTSTFGPGPAGRAFAYSGLALYESVVNGMPKYNSVFYDLSGQQISGAQKDFYWPACINTTMATILKNLFSTASTANLAKIDFLETLNNTTYRSKAPAEILYRSVAFGKKVAEKKPTCVMQFSIF